MKRSRTEIEETILRYALAEENQESFANLLKEILPSYTAWTWGRDSIYRKFFNAWQQSGFNLSPNHYYSPIPDIGTLSDACRKKTEMTGIDLRVNEQLAFLQNVCMSYKAEYAAFPAGNSGKDHEFHFNNGVFERVDAEILHCMIRHWKPRRIVEIGSGYSTLVSAAACELNRKLDNVHTEFSAIEPYPNALFQKQIPGLSRIIQKPLQDMDIEYFTQLGENDILFIDSSHVLKINSDVQMEYLEIIPRVAPGVIIHIHDIFLPAEYPENWVKEEHVFWNEQYLLQAFLAFNESFQVLWTGCHMHLHHSDRLEKAFPGYSPEKYLPGSFWLRRMK